MTECATKDWKTGPHRHKILCPLLDNDRQLSARVQANLPRPMMPTQGYSRNGVAPFKAWAIVNGPNHILIALTCAKEANMPLDSFSTSIYVDRRKMVSGWAWVVVA